MSKDFLLDDTGDLIIGSATGDLTMTTDDNVLLAQQIQSLLNTNFGELDWNDQFGLNHIDVMANSDDLGAIKQILDEFLRDNLDGYSTIKLDSSNYDSATRTLSIVATVTMANGQQVSTQIGGGDM